MTNKKPTKTTNKRASKKRSKATRKPAVKKPKVEDLQQTTGKDYEAQIAKARELEEIMGIPKLSPFRTNDPKVFETMLEDINLTDLQAMAVKAGIFPSGNKTVLKNKVKKAFKSSLIGQGSVTLMGKPLELDPKNPTHKELIDYLNS